MGYCGSIHDNCASDHLCTAIEVSFFRVEDGVMLPYLSSIESS